MSKERVSATPPVLQGTKASTDVSTSCGHRDEKGAKPVVLPLAFNPLRKRDTDVESRLLDYMGEGEGGMV